MRVIKCSSISNAYDKGVEYILKTGVIREVHGTKVLQSDECALEVNIDNPDIFNDKCPFGKNSSIEYVKEFLNPNRGDFSYTYGERLTNYHGQLNQLNNCVDKIKADKYTRQAVCNLWDPISDSKNNDPPCLQNVQFYFNTNDEFTTKVLFRSNDWYGAVLSNMQGLQFLSRFVAEQLNTVATKLILDANTPHIYHYSIEECEKKWGITASFREL